MINYKHPEFVCCAFGPNSSAAVKESGSNPLDRLVRAGPRKVLLVRVDMAKSEGVGRPEKIIQTHND